MSNAVESRTRRISENLVGVVVVCVALAVGAAFVVLDDDRQPTDRVPTLEQIRYTFGQGGLRHADDSDQRNVDLLVFPPDVPMDWWVGCEPEMPSIEWYEPECGVVHPDDPDTVYWTTYLTRERRDLIRAARGETTRVDPEAMRELQEWLQETDTAPVNAPGPQTSRPPAASTSPPSEPEPQPPAGMLLVGSGSGGADDHSIRHMYAWALLDDWSGVGVPDYHCDPVPVQGRHGVCVFDDGVVLHLIADGDSHRLELYR